MFCFFWVCNECGKAVKTFNMTEELGFNFGIDGHMFSDKGKAKIALKKFRRKFLEFGGKKKRSFSNFEEEYQWILRNIKLFNVYLIACEHLHKRN